MSIEVRQFEPADLDRIAADLIALHEAVHGPPDQPGGFARVLRVHSAMEGFLGCVARRDGTPVGFAYGFTGGPGRGWRDAMAAHAGPAVTGEWMDGHFEFAQFLVLEPHRREGIGTFMYEALFETLPHERSILTVREDNEPAIAFYRGKGWEIIAEGFVSSGGHGPYLIMGKIPAG